MIGENNAPDTQNQQDDSNARDTTERQRMSRLANDLAKRAKERQLGNDHGHYIFTNSDNSARLLTVRLTSDVILRETEASSAGRGLQPWLARSADT
jgi:hypothetical protein